jgi:hypothetical protein
MNEDTLSLLGLSPVESLEIRACFDGGALSSDGGVLILHEIEKRLNEFCAMSFAVSGITGPALLSPCAVTGIMGGLR